VVVVGVTKGRILDVFEGQGEEDPRSLAPG
jgi:hypothetical protein